MSKKKSKKEKRALDDVEIEEITPVKRKKTDDVCFVEAESSKTKIKEKVKEKSKTSKQNTNDIVANEDIKMSNPKETEGQNTDDQHKGMKKLKKKKRKEHSDQDTTVQQGDNEHEISTVSDKEKNSMKEKKREKMRLKKLAKKQANTVSEESKEENTKMLNALQYLKLWKDHREVWHFKKVCQTWLLQHFYIPEKISDEQFKMLLKYMVGLKGNARDMTIKKAEELIQKTENGEKDSGQESDPDGEKDEKTEADTDKTNEEVPLEHLKRARKVIQLLSD